MTGPSWKPLAAIPKLQPGVLLFWNHLQDQLEAVAKEALAITPVGPSDWQMSDPCRRERKFFFPTHARAELCFVVLTRSRDLVDRATDLLL
jgi:hypothetical protein